MAKSFVDINMLGDKQLVKDLAKFDQKNQRRIARAALKKGAAPTLDLARQLVPVDRGKLKAALAIKPARGKRNRIGVEINTGTREQLEIEPDDKFYYPSVVEYGSRNMPAKPFMRPAFDRTKDEALTIVGDEMGKNIVRTLKRQGKK